MRTPSDIRDWGFLQKAHKILDFLAKRDEEIVGEAAASQGLDRRRFLKYTGAVAALTVVASKIFTGPDDFWPAIDAEQALKGWTSTEHIGQVIVNSRAATRIEIPSEFWENKSADDVANFMDLIGA